MCTEPKQNRVVRKKEKKKVQKETIESEKKSQ